jgi:hypothetical protein
VHVFGRSFLLKSFTHYAKDAALSEKPIEMVHQSAAKRYCENREKIRLTGNLQQSGTQLRLDYFMAQRCQQRPFPI